MDIVEILRGANLHPTPGRRAVLLALREDECLSAQDIARRLERRPRIPPATVYRALLSLCGAGLARRVPAADGALYMLAPREENAPRLLCSRCGKVEKINSPEVRRYNTALAKKRGAASLLMVADCRRKQCGV